MDSFIDTSIIKTSPCGWNGNTPLVSDIPPIFFRECSRMTLDPALKVLKDGIFFPPKRRETSGTRLLSALATSETFTPGIGFLR